MHSAPHCRSPPFYFTTYLLPIGSQCPHDKQCQTRQPFQFHVSMSLSIASQKRLHILVSPFPEPTAPHNATVIPITSPAATLMLTKGHTTIHTQHVSYSASHPFLSPPVTSTHAYLLFRFITMKYSASVAAGSARKKARRY